MHRDDAYQGRSSFDILCKKTSKAMQMKRIPCNGRDRYTSEKGKDTKYWKSAEKKCYGPTTSIDIQQS